MSSGDEIIAFEASFKREFQENELHDLKGRFALSQRHSRELNVTQPIDLGDSRFVQSGERDIYPIDILECFRGRREPRSTDSLAAKTVTPADGFAAVPLDGLTRIAATDPRALATSLAAAAASIARLDQALAGHPLAQAFLYRMRLVAVRHQAAADGTLIDPWHLAATVEGLRLRMDPYLRIIDRADILEMVKTALTLHNGWSSRISIRKARFSASKLCSAGSPPPCIRCWRRPRACGTGSMPARRGRRCAPPCSASGANAGFSG